MLFVVITICSVPHSWLITGFVTRATALQVCIAKLKLLLRQLYCRHHDFVWSMRNICVTIDHGSVVVRKLHTPPPCSIFSLMYNALWIISYISFFFFCPSIYGLWFLLLYIKIVSKYCHFTGHIWKMTYPLHIKNSRDSKWATVWYTMAWLSLAWDDCNTIFVTVFHKEEWPT